MQVREFMGGDFDPAARILGSTWHDIHGNESHWQGADELCAYLSMSDYGNVVLSDEGDLLGIILLRGSREEDHNETMRMHWLQQRTRLAAMANALGINARADALVLVKETELMDRCAEERGSEGVGIIELIIVSADARGMGVGRTLLREGFEWLESRGCHTLRLITDEGCDWQLYEHLGMERVAADSVPLSVVADKPDREEKAFRFFVYEAPLSALAARFA